MGYVIYYFSRQTTLLLGSLSFASLCLWEKDLFAAGQVTTCDTNLSTVGESANNICRSHLNKRKAIAALAIAKSHTNTPFVREIDSPIVSNINMAM